MTPARGERMLLAPGFGWLLLFTAAPVALVVAMSLAARGAPVTWTLDGSAWARLADARHAQILARSFGMAGAATAACLLLGLPLAWFTARRPEPWRSRLHLLVMLPLWANTLALLCAWKVILGRGGPLDRAAGALGALPEDGTLGLLYTPGAVLVGLVYAYLPLMVHGLYQSMERFDGRLLEAAEDLGATRVAALRRVMLPAVRPGIVAGCVLVFVPSLSTFVVPDILGGARTTYVGNAARDAFLQSPQDAPLGCALAVALLAVTGAAAWAWFRSGARDAAAA
ncbi:MAG: Spermidine/putrescine transport system permease protein PotB [Planctomycetes bacterium]|nr:Spermidine/putrescine transport system permease protein PotB [Planctomycetota bacterium]